jgi:hypothetical protein
MGRWGFTDVRADFGSLWSRVSELVELAPNLAALRAHGLHLLAARAWDAQARPVPSGLRRDQRRAAMMAMAASPLLERARAGYQGPMMLMKGPEVAARYRDPGARYFRDLDLLVDDAQAAQQALVAGGFIELGNPAAYDDRQHLCPLIWPGLPLIIELHRNPNCVPWLALPSTRELFKRTVPSATGVAGLLAPAPAAHALLLTAHVWAHQPLARLADLIDVAAVLGRTDRKLVDDLARDWGWEGIWGTTIEVVDAIFASPYLRPASLRIWARHLESARERTVLENHIARLAAPAFSLPLTRAPRAVTAALVREAARHEDEPWANKLHRSRLAVAHAFIDKSEHDRTLSGSRSNE